MAASKTVPATAPKAKFRDSMQQARQVTEDPADVRARLEAAGEDMRSPQARAADEGNGTAPRTRAQIQAEMDPQEWACRSQEHSWPQLRAGITEIPRGVSVRPGGNGCVLIIEDCLHDCGRYRETLTGPRGFYDSGASRRYGTRKGRRHTVVHQNESMAKSEMRKETFDTLRGMLREAAKATAAAEREAIRAAKS